MTVQNTGTELYDISVSCYMMNYPSMVWKMTFLNELVQKISKEAHVKYLYF